jgi:hypothetical protein
MEAAFFFVWMNGAEIGNRQRGVPGAMRYAFPRYRDVCCRQRLKTIFPLAQGGKGRQG